MNYKEKLVELRSDNFYTQEEIGKQLGISRSNYKDYELQIKIIPLKYLIKLSDFYNVSIDYLLDLTKEESYKNSKNGVNCLDAGIRLKEFREKHKITQSKLASMLNTVQPVIANYENGKNLIATPFLYTICKKYSISADYLLGKID